MKFTAFAVASMVGVSAVLAAPARIPNDFEAAPFAAAIAKPAAAVPAAPQVTSAPLRATILDAAPLHQLYARDMDPQEAQQLISGIMGGGYNCNGNGNNRNNNWNQNNNWNDDNSGDDSGDWGCSDSYGGGSVQDLQNYVNQASSQLSQAQQALRSDMNGNVPRFVADYLKSQSSRIWQASKIANGGQDQVTKSASQFVSLASAYAAAQASFTPQAHRVEQQIQQTGTWNAAAGSKAPTMLTLGGAVGAMLVWVAL